MSRPDHKHSYLLGFIGSAPNQEAIDDLELLWSGGTENNDSLLAFYQANGATSGSLNDAAYEFLVAAGITPAALPEMFNEYWQSSPA